jgi:hypothetical protein
MAEDTPLKLRFEDAEDLAVVSLHVQDAILRVGDMRYEAQKRRFGLFLNRFRWERAKRFRLRPDERVRSGLHFDGVLAVQVTGIPQSHKEDLLVLLSIGFEPGEAPAGTVRLEFAGAAQVTLTCECLDGALTDIGLPWIAAKRPRHPV